MRPVIGAVSAEALSDNVTPPRPRLTGDKPPGPQAAFAPFAPAPVEARLELAQHQVDQLRRELDGMRGRDVALGGFMHRIDEELRLAARLQRDFLPKNLPELGRVRFHSLFRPAGYVSGDLYDVMRLDERHVGFYMADAVGHGVPAALLTMFIKHALQTKEITPAGYRLLEPGESLRRLNESLIEQDLSQATFATALYGTIDVDSLTVKLAKAGHPSPIVMRAGGAFELLHAEGPLLGIFPGEVFENWSAQLYPGDRLLLYTDGVEVAFWDDRTIDSGRWQAELSALRHLSSDELLHDLAGRLDRESGSLQPKDDLTMVIVEALR
jgi:serine phosphatase RsbU (regulator of sigma subunit)